MKKSIVRKGIVIAIIVLFVGASVVPSMYHLQHPRVNPRLNHRASIFIVLLGD